MTTFDRQPEKIIKPELTEPNWQKTRKKIQLTEENLKKTRKKTKLTETKKNRTEKPESIENQKKNKEKKQDWQKKGWILLLLKCPQTKRDKKKGDFFFFFVCVPDKNWSAEVFFCMEEKNVGIILKHIPAFHVFPGRGGSMERSVYILFRHEYQIRIN